MKNIFYIFSFTFFSLNASAQQWEWAKNISIEEWDYGMFIVPSPNNIFVAGAEGYLGSASSDIFIRKYDTNGNLLSSVIDTACYIYGFAADEFEHSYALLKINDTIYIRKYNEQGGIVWTLSKSISAIAIYKNILYAASNDTIFKYDLNGSLIIAFACQPGIMVYKLATDVNGSLIIVGEKNWGAYLAKYDSSGNFLWDFNTSGTYSGPTRIRSIDIDSSANIYITGNFRAGINIGCSYFVATGVNNLFVAKFSTDGTCIWAEMMGGDGYDGGVFGKHVIKTNSGVFVIAYIYDYCFHGNDTIQVSTDYAFLKYDLNGQFLSVNSFPLFASGAMQKDNALYFTGNFIDTIVLGSNLLISSNAADGYVAKYSPSSLTFTSFLTNSDFISKIYPNPSIGKFTIESPEKIYAVAVTNLLGEKIYQMPVSSFANNWSPGSYRDVIDLTTSPKGIYFVEMIYGNERKTKKIIIE